MTTPAPLKALAPCPKLVLARQICAEVRPDYADGFLSGEFDKSSTEIRVALAALARPTVPDAGEGVNHPVDYSKPHLPSLLNGLAHVFLAFPNAELWGQTNQATHAAQIVRQAG